MREVWLNRTPVDEFVHNKILELFRLYLIVGGMPAYNVEEPKTPLLLTRSRNLFKLFQSDIGLLASQYAEGIQLRIIKGDNDINFGSIYENAVAQELVAHGIVPYYYNNKKRGELDFVIELGGNNLYTNIYDNVFRKGQYGSDLLQGRPVWIVGLKTPVFPAPAPSRPVRQWEPRHRLHGGHPDVRCPWLCPWRPGVSCQCHCVHRLRQ